MKHPIQQLMPPLEHVTGLTLKAAMPFGGKYVHIETEDGRVARITADELHVINYVLSALGVAKQEENQNG